MYKLLIKAVVCIISIAYAVSFLKLNELSLVILIGLSVSFLIDILDEKFSLAVYTLFFIASMNFPILFFAYPLVLLASYSFKPYVLVLPLICIFKFGLNTTSLMIYSLSALAYLCSYFENQFNKYEDKLSKKDDIFTLQSKQKKLDELKAVEEKNKDIEIAILSERNRISREIHDSVGHTISGAIIQTEAIRNESYPELNKQIDAIQANLKSGMNDIRSSLHHLHDKSLNLELALKEILENSTSLDYDLKYKINSELNYESKYKITSILKEAIANTSKHSNASNISVSLLELPKHISINIGDNGNTAVNKVDIKNGLGFLSFKDFAEKHGGRFTYDFEDGMKLMFLLDKETLI